MRSIPRRSPSIGVIGAGAFGLFAAVELARHFTVRIHDPDTGRQARAAALGLGVAAMQEAAAADIVVLAVPWRHLAAVATALRPGLRPDALIVDVASIKAEPLRILAARLPEHEVIGLHPLFGPQSGANGLLGLPMVLCTPQTPAARRLCRFFRQRLGLEVIAMTAEDHDREMAIVQGLTHVIARSLVGLELPSTRLATTSFRHLRAMMDMVGRDSDAVFHTIVTDNPHALPVAEAFGAQLAATLANCAAVSRSPAMSEG